MRIGNGYDVHRFGRNRKLIIGGVAIPYELGLIGHSDADVLVHAIMDSLLGAAGLRDIGVYFPDTDEQYRGISSIELLKKVGELISDELYMVGNIDSIIVAQNPKMKPYIPQMKKNIAEALGIEEDRVGIKATTEEHLGFTGSGEGIAAHAVCILENMMDNYRVAGSSDMQGGCAACSGCSKNTET